MTFAYRALPGRLLQLLTAAPPSAGCTAADALSCRRSRG